MADAMKENKNERNSYLTILTSREQFFKTKEKK